MASRLGAEGQLSQLVRHLALTELHLEQGPQRQGLLKGLQLEPEALRTERQRLYEDWRWEGPGLGEPAILDLYLDGQLSWPMVRPRWTQVEAVPKLVV